MKKWETYADIARHGRCKSKRDIVLECIGNTIAGTLAIAPLTTWLVPLVLPVSAMVVFGLTLAVCAAVGMNITPTQH